MALAGLDVWQVIELVSGEIVGAHMVELELLLVCDIRCVHMAFEWVDFAPFLALRLVVWRDVVVHIVLTISLL